MLFTDSKEDDSYSKLTSELLVSLSELLESSSALLWLLESLSLSIILATAGNRKPYPRHREAPPTTGSGFQGSQLAEKNGAILKHPLSFESNGFGLCLCMI